MQWLRANVLPIGKWRVFAIILAGLVAFGADDFANMFLPAKWITHNTQILGWVQFIAYLVVCTVAVWLFVSFAWWVCKNAGQWAKPIMKWLHNKIPLKFRSWSEFISCIQQIYKTIVRCVDWAMEPALLVGFCFFLWLAYGIYSDPEALPKNELDQMLEVLKFYAYVAGGILLIWQVRISNRRATALEKTAALGQKSNITERFKNAIEHLGGDLESIRMGGIYGLYHVVRESCEYADTVCKILYSHAKSIMVMSEYAEREKPSNEIAAILDVLFPVIPDGENQKIEVLFTKVNASSWDLHGADVSSRDMRHIHGSTVNLSKANLDRADMSNVKLTKVNLSEARLLEANLSGANLQRVNLSEAQLFKVNLSRAWLRRAKLPGAKLPQANLSGAKLFSANLSGAKLPRANLSGARLFRVNLSGARLFEANLSKARLLKADLSGARLHRTDLSGARLPRANLSGAKLLRTNLSGAKLPQADLSETDLWRADLSGADLSEAIITVEQLLKAKTLHKAELDDHIREKILRRKPELLDLPVNFF